MVLYFTGTGNSEFVAKALADALEDQVISSNEYIKEGREGYFKSDKPFVFVFPVYLSTIAKVFAQFIIGATFEGSKDAYFVATAASEMGATPNECRKICNIKKFNYKGTELVAMPQNYIALFKMTEPSVITERIDKARIKTVEIANKIREGRELSGKLKSGFEYTGTKIVEKIYNGPFTGTRRFRVSDECNGCGLCEKNCVLNNIVIENGRPKWIKSCVHCMACINRCPRKAIEYGKTSVGKERYVCVKYKREL